MRGPHVCPWWFAYTFDNPLRTIFHKPEQILGPYLRPGMTVLDMGCGMGYFSIGMARLTGPGGRVLALDLQEKMLAAVRRRASRAGLAPRIETRLCKGNTLPLDEPLDFALAFWMLHEVPDRIEMLARIRTALRPEGRLLLTEPILHVSKSAFERTIEEAAQAGLNLLSRPSVAFSRAALLSA